MREVILTAVGNDKIASYVMENPWTIWLAIALIIWTIVWKMIALWKASRSNHLVAFIVLFFLNTFGIVDMFYILYLKRKEKKENQIIQ